MRAVASGLIARGLPAGNRIALMQPNTLEFITTYFGILRAGMCAVPLNTGYTAIELDQMLSDVDASLVVADPRMAPVLDQVPGIDVIHTGTEDWRRFTVGSSPLPVEPTAPDALAVLLFTSGTSGRPKAAMLTHRALSANLDQLSAVQDPPAMTSDDVVMCVLPCSHLRAQCHAGHGGPTRRHHRADRAVRRRGRTRLDHPAQGHQCGRCPPMYVAWARD